MFTVYRFVCRNVISNRPSEQRSEDIIEEVQKADGGDLQLLQQLFAYLSFSHSAKRDIVMFFPISHEYG